MPLRKRNIPTVEFVPVEKAFKPMVEVVLLASVSGWVNDDKGTKKRWNLPAGSTQVIDDEHARDFVAKGYAAYRHKKDYKDSGLTDEEIAERKASVTKLSLGGANG
jgi:hypothetical protein